MTIDTTPDFTELGYEIDLAEAALGDVQTNLQGTDHDEVYQDDDDESSDSDFPQDEEGWFEEGEQTHETNHSDVVGTHNLAQVREHDALKFVSRTSRVGGFQPNAFGATIDTDSISFVLKTPEDVHSCLLHDARVCVRLGPKWGRRHRTVVCPQMDHNSLGLNSALCMPEPLSKKAFHYGIATSDLSGNTYVVEVAIFLNSVSTKEGKKAWLSRCNEVLEKVWEDRNNWIDTGARRAQMRDLVQTGNNNNNIQCCMQKEEFHKFLSLFLKGIEDVALLGPWENFCKIVISGIDFKGDTWVNVAAQAGMQELIQTFRSSLLQLGRKGFIHLGRTLDTCIFCKVDGCLSLLKIDEDQSYLFIGRQNTQRFLKHRTSFYSRYLLWDCLGGVTREARPFQDDLGAGSESFGAYVRANRQQFERDFGLNLYETSTVENVVDRFTHRLRTDVKLKLSQLQPKDLEATHSLLMSWFDVYNVPSTLDSNKLRLEVKCILKSGERLSPGFPTSEENSAGGDESVRNFIKGAAQVLAAAIWIVRQQVEIVSLDTEELRVHIAWERALLDEMLASKVLEVNSANGKEKVSRLVEFIILAQGTLTLFNIAVTGKAWGSLSTVLTRSLRTNSILRPEKIMDAIQQAIDDDGLDTLRSKCLKNTLKWEGLLQVEGMNRLIELESPSPASVASVILVMMFKEAFTRAAKKRREVQWQDDYDVSFKDPVRRSRILHDICNRTQGLFISNNNTSSTSSSGGQRLANHLTSTEGTWVACRLCTFALGLITRPFGGTPDEQELKSELSNQSGTLTLDTQKPTSKKSLWAKIGSLIVLEEEASSTNAGSFKWIPIPKKMGEDFSPMQLNLRQLPWDPTEAALWIACCDQLVRRGKKNFKLLNRSYAHGFYHRDCRSCYDLIKEYKRHKKGKSKRKIFSNNVFKAALEEFLNNGINIAIERQYIVERYEARIRMLEKGINGRHAQL